MNLFLDEGEERGDGSQGSCGNPRHTARAGAQTRTANVANLLPHEQEIYLIQSLSRARRRGGVSREASRQLGLVLLTKMMVVTMAVLGRAGRQKRKAGVVGFEEGGGVRKGHRGVDHRLSAGAVT